MAYIIVVNPAILSFAGIPAGPSTVATILTAAFGTLLMGLFANRPIAVAPYMGENAFIAFGLAAFGITWQQRLGGNYSASPVFADGRIYVLSEEGMTTVFAPGEAFQRLAVNRLEGTTLASMAIADGSLFIRSDTHLYRIASRAAKAGL